MIKGTFMSAVVAVAPQYAAPASGSAVAIADATRVLIIEPAGALLALTITMPSTNLVDGEEVAICSSAAITTVTLNGGTIIGALTALALGGFARYVYRAGKWYRCG